MAIATNDTLPKFGTQDALDDGGTVTIANNAYSVAGDITAWTNDEDATFANFILKLQFDGTAPLVGVVDLFAKCINIQSTNAPATPDDNYPHIYLDSFPLDFDIAIDIDYYTTIEHVKLPLFKSSQEIEFYLKNNGTGQTIGIDWRLWISPYTFGPMA